ncbi:MRC1 [Branchiostoma lanceolatum]|uniref:MRC1 protein n=1 Tax=Branchiostoma lanceolatum TaxID=7740 RepID=A0A8J9YZ92_BRALA|nr:MRC1 [Branchiostoma lanceolatum]
MGFTARAEVDRPPTPRRCVRSHTDGAKMTRARPVSRLGAVVLMFVVLTEPVVEAQPVFVVQPTNTPATASTPATTPTPAAVSQDTCEPNWHSHGSRCFRAFDVEVSYADARAICLSHKSHLGLPKDQATNDFVVQLRNSVNNGMDAWIGLNDMGQEGTFVWEDGEVLGSFDDFAQVDMSGNDADCVLVKRGAASTRPNRWADKSCTRLLGTICEKDGYTSLAEACYKVFTEETETYTDAQTHCANEGGHLAMPKDKATNQLLTYLTDQASKEYPTVSFYFFGLTFVDDKNAYRWNDGSDLVGFSNWALAAEVTDLLVDTVSETCIGISWTAPASQVDGYQVVVFKDNMEAARQNIAGDVTTHEQCSLTPGYPYTFEVASTRNGNRSSVVQIASVTYPTDPTNVTTTNVTENSVTITWERACCNVEIYHFKRPNGKITKVAVPTPPMDVSLVSSADTIIVTWALTGVRNSTSLEISPAEANDSMIVVEPDAVSAKFEGLTSGRKYTVLITTWSRQKLYHAQANASTSTAPGKPQDLQILSQHGSLQVTWAAPSGNVNRYSLTLAAAADGVEQTRNTTTLTSFTFRGRRMIPLFNPQTTVWGQN